MQTCTFHNHDTDQKVIITIEEKGDDWNVSAEFFPDLGQQDKESAHYMAANLLLTRIMGEVKPQDISLS